MDQLSLSESRASPTPTPGPPYCGPDCWLKGICQASNNDQLEPLQTQGPISTGNRPIHGQDGIYTPLLPWQTRVISVLPASSACDLQCALYVADLVCFPGLGLPSTREVVQFEALSYTWGSSAPDSVISCNGTAFPVTQNLHQALQRLRLPDRPRYIWADAICINQADPKEKSSQVRNMFAIYQKATEVVVWLGDSKPDEFSVLGILDRLSALEKEERNLADVHDAACAALFPRVAESIAAVLKRPWFARTWVRQELFANQNVKLLCGQSAATFDSFCIGIDVFRRTKGLEDPNHHLDAVNFGRLHTLRTSRAAPGTSLKKNAPPIPISAGIWLAGLISSSQFDATDPRDKVYGVIGMVEEQVLRYHRAYCTSTSDLTGLPIPAIDYTRSLSVVYQDAVKFLITRHRNLLPLIIFQDRARSRPDLPSWAIDFDSNVVRWILTTHWPSSDLSKLPPKPLKRDPTAWKKLVSDPQSLATWSSFRGDFDAPKPDLDQLDDLHLIGYKVGVIRTEVAGESAWLSLQVAQSGFLRTPLPVETVYKLSRGKRVVESDDSTLATVQKLITDCNQKIIKITIFDDFSPEGGPSNDLCETLLVSSLVKEGDTIALLHGSMVPFVLRLEHSSDKSGTSPEMGRYTFLGPALFLTMPPPEAGLTTGYEKTVAIREKLLERGNKQYKQYLGNLIAAKSRLYDFVLI